MKGLQVFNDTNSLQISTDFIDMAFTGSRQVNNTDARSTVPFYAVIGTSKTGFISPTNPRLRNASGSGTVYDFTLDYLDHTEKDRLGLELYGADGKVYYNSNYKSISVLDRIILNPTRYSPVTPTLRSFYTKNYGSKKVAILLIRDMAHFYFNQGNRTNLIFTAAFMQEDNGTLNVRSIPTEEIYTGGDPTSTPSDSNYLEFLVIDVTNY